MSVTFPAYHVFDFSLLLDPLPIPVDLHTQVVSGFLPVELTVLHREKVLHTDLLSGRDLDENDPGGRIPFLWLPIADNIVCGGPGEVTDLCHLDTLLL